MDAPNEEPGLVLIHGSMLGSWIWEGVVPHLALPSLAMDLPGRGNHPAPPRSVGLKDAADSVVADIQARGFDRVVLVGHSIGGLVAAAAAEVLPSQVQRLIFISAVIPREGRSWASEMPIFSRAVLRLALTVQRGGARAPDRLFKASSGSGIDDRVLETEILPRLVPEAPRLFLDPLRWSQARQVARTYVRLNQDRDIAPDLQDRVIDGLQPVDVVSLDSGHLPMVTCPLELAAAINAAAARCKDEPGGGPTAGTQADLQPGQTD